MKQIEICRNRSSDLLIKKEVAGELLFARVEEMAEIFGVEQVETGL